jgi:hypothetical protein
MADAYPWQNAYRQAFMESDPNRLRDRVAVAEKAVAVRTEELTAAPTDISHLEMKALRAAVDGLAKIKATRLAGDKAQADEIRP